MNNDIARCLAHGADGKPNGCPRAAQCERHTVLLRDLIDDATPITGRACASDELENYIASGRT